MIDLSASFTSASFTENDFLASKADLVGLLAQLASSNGRQSSRIRQDAQLARQGLGHLFPDTASRDRLDETPLASRRLERRVFHGAPVSETPKAGVTDRPTTQTGSYVDASRIRRRQHCKCGQCQWCLDNARWDRIFNEKFADPAYYGGLKVRQNSTLAGAI